MCLISKLTDSLCELKRQIRRRTNIIRPGSYEAPLLYQVKAKQLIGHLKDYTSVSWNAKDEMVVSGKPLPRSNISVLVNDIIGKVKHEVDPVGRKSNNLVKLNVLAVSLKMLKSRES